MQNMFQVAIHFGKSYGRIEYNPDTKSANVILDNQVKRAEIEQFLGQKRTMLHALGAMREFESLEVQPLDSLESLKLALTNLWEETGVLVDWSRPADDKYRV